MKRTLGHGLVLLLMCCWTIAGTARADSLAVTVSIGSPNTSGSGTNQVFGWDFTPTVDLVANSLGVMDFGENGLGDPHEVAIWVAASPATPLVSATVPAGTSATLAGGFRYIPVAPTLLSAGTEYVIAAHYPGTSDFFVNSTDTNVSITLDPLVGFGDRRYSFSTGPSIFFPSSIDTVTIGAFGPSFTFDAALVPEPSALVMLLVGTAEVGFLGLLRRRR